MYSEPSVVIIFTAVATHNRHNFFQNFDSVAIVLTITFLAEESHRGVGSLVGMVVMWRYVKSAVLPVTNFGLLIGLQ